MTPRSEPALALRGLSITRRTVEGDVPVLRDIDLTLQPGRWLALVGANGSGKSSLLEFLADRGGPPGEAAIVFQDPDDQLITSTVERELTLGRPGLDVAAWLEEFGLQGLAERNPRLLSAGQKQRLALAVALAGQPRLLLCDEVTALQDREQAVWLLDLIDRWRRQVGGTVISATQWLPEVERADRVAVLAAGGIVLEGSPQQVCSRPEVRDLLLDDFPATPAPAEPAPAAVGDRPPVLQLAGVRLDFPPGGPGLVGVDIELPPGGRLGVTGPSGCGKSSLLAACVGMRPVQAGTVRLNGRLLYRKDRLDLDHGAALLAPQFPEYLFTSGTVADEIRLDPVFAKLAPQEVLASAGLAADLLVRHPHALSSGQRRRLALALVVLAQRPLLLLDEPTAALDRPGRRQILRLLDRVPAHAAVVIASHDRDFLRAAGCRLLDLAAYASAGP